MKISNLIRPVSITIIIVFALYISGIDLVTKSIWFLNVKGALKFSIYTLSNLTLLFFVNILFASRLKYVFLFLTSFLLTANYAYNDVQGSAIYMHDVYILISEYSHFSDAVSSFFSVELLYFFIGVYFSIFLLIKNSNDRFNFPITLGSLVSGILIVFGIISSTAGGTVYFVEPFKSLAMLGYGLNTLPVHQDRRVVEPINKLSSNAKFKNIVLIVDESISGYHLSINGYPKETTPYLKSISDQYINFGLSISSTNCSSSSTTLLRTPIDPNLLPDEKGLNLFSSPTLFTYGKASGFNTYFMSSQRKGNKLQNFMTKFDLRDIDHFMNLGGFADVKNRDQYLAKKIISVLGKGDDRKFIYALKLGAHFPWYSRKYPKESAEFFPVLKDGQKIGFSVKEKTNNSYDNIVRWNVDHFFKTLLNGLDLSDTLIIYTSDHGQNILDADYVATHCTSTNPSIYEGVVPLLVFDKKISLKRKKLIEESISVKELSGRSHFHIPNTILWAMGFKVESNKILHSTDIQKYYYFLSGDLFGRTTLNRNEFKN